LFVFILAVVVIPSGWAVGQDPDSNTAPARDSIRAMSFNIRLGVAKDGPNHWDKRRDLVIQTIKDFDADVIGTQETWDFQAKYLSENLPGYTYVGRSRQNSNTGEQCGILFRDSRFDKLIEGHFWLSETPDRPGSKSWDSSLPRMVTWLKLWDRHNERSVYVVNTHFDHIGKVARNQSAMLIREFVTSLPAPANVIVTGDFNAAQDSAPYRSLFGNATDSTSAQPQSPLIDTYRETHPSQTKTEGTFSAFNGATEGARIDWIAVSRSFQIVSATIDRTSFENRYPSDHYPVTAELKFGHE
jgi:endonuclease/exonuclease/phosphatase family metal-dependent hydrolase